MRAHRWHHSSSYRGSITPKPLWLGLVYLAAFVVAIDLVAELPSGVFAAAFAWLVVTLYGRFVWREPSSTDLVFGALAKQSNAEPAL